MLRFEASKKTAKTLSVQGPASDLLPTAKVSNEVEGKGGLLQAKVSYSELHKQWELDYPNHVGDL